MDRDGGSESFDSFYERELAPQVRRSRRGDRVRSCRSDDPYKYAVT